MQINAISAGNFSYNNCKPATVVLKHSNTADIFGKNIVFKSATSAGNVLKKLHGLTCPYYGCKMIPGGELSRIEKKLDKCKNLNDAITELSKYTAFMQKTEKAIYERLKIKAGQSPNSTIDSCLREWYDDAIIKLKLEEFNVLDNVDKISQKLSPQTALILRSKTTRCRQIILANNQEDTFKRKTFLNSLNEITPLPGEAAVFEQMKDMALYLPTSGSSENAFIVKYANRSHAETAKRLLRASVATIEHIKPESLGGSNSLDNFVLASASANSYRSNMPLNKYINRFPDIPANCQKYINKLLKLMNAGALKGFETYPYKIKKCLFNESKGLIKIKITNYKYTEAAARTAEIRFRLKKH